MPGRQAAATDRSTVEESSQRRPDQFPDVPHDAERESQARGKSEGSEDGDLAALLCADLCGDDEEDPVDGDRQHFDSERRDDRYGHQQEATDPVGLEGSPRIGQREHERGERDTSWVVSEELPEAGPECGAPGGRSSTAPSLQAGCDGNRGQETDAAGAGEEREDGDRKSTRLNSSHGYISYAVFC